MYNNSIEKITAAQNGDKKSMEELIISNTPLIRSIVSRFSGRGTEDEDLFQIGAIGFIKAVNNFNSEFNVVLSTYAVPMIMGEIRRHLRSDGMIKVSRTLKETSQKAIAVTAELEKRFGRSVTIEEVSENLGIPAAEVAMAFEATRPPESIYQTVAGTETLLLDKLPDDSVNPSVDILAIMEMLKTDSEKERMLIYYRYYSDKTQVETAKLMNLSQVQISRMEKRILERLRERLKD